VSQTAVSPCSPPCGDAGFWERYRVYMESAEWEAKRRRVLGRAHYVCEGCGQRKAEHVHHLDYSNFGNEFLWQLVAVCQECHERAHGRRIGRKKRSTPAVMS
jgi:5-methylcytosine-specific restriction endonuclease McrA